MHTHPSIPLTSGSFQAPSYPFVLLKLSLLLRRYLYTCRFPLLDSQLACPRPPCQSLVFLLLHRFCVPLLFAPLLCTPLLSLPQCSRHVSLGLLDHQDGAGAVVGAVVAHAAKDRPEETPRKELSASRSYRLRGDIGRHQCSACKRSALRSDRGGLLTRVMITG